MTSMLPVPIPFPGTFHEMSPPSTAPPSPSAASTVSLAEDVAPGTFLGVYVPTVHPRPCTPEPEQQQQQQPMVPNAPRRRVPRMAAAYTPGQGNYPHRVPRFELQTGPDSDDELEMEVDTQDAVFKPKGRITRFIMQAPLYSQTLEWGIKLRVSSLVMDWQSELIEMDYFQRQNRYVLQLTLPAEHREHWHEAWNIMSAMKFKPLRQEQYVIHEQDGFDNVFVGNAVYFE